MSFCPFCPSAGRAPRSPPFPAGSTALGNQEPAPPGDSGKPRTTEAPATGQAAGHHRAGAQAGRELPRPEGDRDQQRGTVGPAGVRSGVGARPWLPGSPPSLQPPFPIRECFWDLPGPGPSRQVRKAGAGVPGEEVTHPSGAQGWDLRTASPGCPGPTTCFPHCPWGGRHLRGRRQPRPGPLGREGLSFPRGRTPTTTPNPEDPLGPHLTSGRRGKLLFILNEVHEIGNHILMLVTYM